MKDYFIKHRNEIFLILILFIAISVRLLFLLEKEVPIFADSVLYAESGKNFIETGNYSTFSGDLVDIVFPPGYPIAFGIADHFFNNVIFSLRFVSFIFGCFLVYLFYLVGKEISGRDAGLFAAFLSATNASLIQFSHDIFSESMFFFLSLLSFYFYLKLEKNSKTNTGILLGLSIGISYLIRPEGLLLLVLPFIFLLNIAKNFRIQIIACFLVAMLSSFAVMAPYIYFLSKSTGQATLSAKMSTNLIHGDIFNGVEKTRIDQDTFLRYEQSEANYDEKTNSLVYPKEEYKDTSVLTAVLDTDFSSRYSRGINSELYVLILDHWIGIIIPFIALAVIYSLKKRIYRKHVFALLSMSLLLLFMFPVFHIESRYLVQVLIFFILLASIGYSIKDFPKINIFGRRLRLQKYLNAMKAAALALIFLQFAVFMYLSLKINDSDGFCNSFICFDVYAKDRYFPPDEKSPAFEYKIAGEFIRNDAEGRIDAIIMSRRPIEISFYADMNNLGIMIPYTSAGNIIRFAKANKVNYIVIDERFLKIRENYEELLNLGDYSEDSELIFEDNSIRSIRIFKIKYDN